MLLKRYSAGIYARLSSKHSGGLGTASIKEDSLNAQIRIAENFVQEFNDADNGEIIDIVGRYTDFGKTGSSFEREGFMKLMQDIRLGKINCVIVKDLSRFGRNYLEAGKYIEKIFPFLGVRFICVADNFDTGAAENENKQMALEIKNLVNDIYAKDFSKKAKLSLEQRRHEGSYVGGPAPYGYVAVRKGKKRVLIADNNTAAVVRFIYEEFARTGSYAKVTGMLNERKVNPPSVYKRTKSVYYKVNTLDADNTYKTESIDNKADKDSTDGRDNTEAAGSYKPWDKSAVVRILNSDTYAGFLVQGKTSITARNEKNRISRPPKEWVVTENAHEPLIDFDLYNRVVKLRIRRM